jgi:hypothetical protein
MAPQVWQQGYEVIVSGKDVGEELLKCRERYVNLQQIHDTPIKLTGRDTPLFVGNHNIGINHPFDPCAASLVLLQMPS